MNRFALAATTVLAPCATAQVLYFADFSRPPGTYGTSVVPDLGAIPRTSVSRDRFGINTVLASFGDLTDGVLKLDRVVGQSSAQVTFDVENLIEGVPGIDSPIYIFEFDMLIDVQSPSASFGVTLFFDAPRIQRFTFFTDGSIVRLEEGTPNLSIPTGTFNTSEVNNIRWVIFPDDQRLEFYLNGSEIYAGPVLFPDTEPLLRSARISSSLQNTIGEAVYIDNVRLQAFGETFAPADLNKDGSFDFEDINLFVSSFLQGNP